MNRPLSLLAGYLLGVVCAGLAAFMYVQHLEGQIPSD